MTTDHTKDLHGKKFPPAQTDGVFSARHTRGTDILCSMDHQTQATPTRNRGGRPRKIKAESTRVDVVMSKADMEIAKQRAAEMGLSLRDFFAWSSYVVMGRPVPDYIQRQLEAHDRQRMQERLVS